MFDLLQKFEQYRKSSYNFLLKRSDIELVC